MSASIPSSAIEDGEPEPLAAEQLRWVSPSELRSYRFPPANDALLDQIIEARAVERCRRVVALGTTSVRHVKVAAEAGRPWAIGARCRWPRHVYGTKNSSFDGSKSSSTGVCPAESPSTCTGTASGDSTSMWRA